MRDESMMMSLPLGCPRAEIQGLADPMAQTLFPFPHITMVKIEKKEFSGRGIHSLL
jgi:hypothetical protein